MNNEGNELEKEAIDRDDAIYCSYDTDNEAEKRAPGAKDPQVKWSGGR